MTSDTKNAADRVLSDPERSEGISAGSAAPAIPAGRRTHGPTLWRVRYRTKPHLSQRFDGELVTLAASWKHAILDLRDIHPSVRLEDCDIQPVGT